MPQVIQKLKVNYPVDVKLHFNISMTPGKRWFEETLHIF